MVLIAPVPDHGLPFTVSFHVANYCKLKCSDKWSRSHNQGDHHVGASFACQTKLLGPP